MVKKKTFESAKKEISEKFNYLELLEFNGNEKVALFLDKEYGEFAGKYKSILQKTKKHPVRSKIDKVKKQKETFLKKYGVDNPSKIKNIREKAENTNLIKYGFRNVSCSNEIKEKKKRTFNKNYNCDYGFQSDQIKNKSIKTWLKKYGTTNPSKSHIIKEKIKQTNLEKYGCENISQSKGIKIKKENTFYCKYGFNTNLLHPDIKDKIKKTMIEKYGVEHQMYNKEIIHKVIKTKIQNKIINDVNGHSLFDFYKKSGLKNKIAYTTLAQNRQKFGDIALTEEHYKQLYKKSKIADLWLNSIEEKLGYQILKEYHIPTTRYHADGYDPKTNVIYEFYGDYWHGNLNKFIATDIHPVKDTTYQELYNYTIDRQNKIIKLGYNVIYIWESDFN